MNDNTSEKSMNVLINYDTEIFDTEILDDLDIKIDNNSLKKLEYDIREIYKKLIKLYNDFTETRKLSDELYRMNFQNYLDDIDIHNSVVSLHNSFINYANGLGIQFFRFYNNNYIWYRVNSYGEIRKLKNKGELYSLLGIEVNIYNNIEDIKFLDNFTSILIVNYLDLVEKEVFFPNYSDEWLYINRKKYKNTFKYTKYLNKKLLVRQQENLSRKNEFSSISAFDTLSPSPAILTKNPPFPSTINDLHFLGWNLAVINNELRINNSIIEDFIYSMFDNEYNSEYIIYWLAHFFQNLNKSARAIVIIGDKETTDILVNNIIKPIFAYKKEYFATIDDKHIDKLIKESKNKTVYNLDKVIKNKIFYHIDNLNKHVNDKQISNLVLQLTKPNSATLEQFIEDDETFIHGELIVTSNDISPYTFLKDSYSRCSVFKVKDLSSILKKLNMERLALEENIQNDLDNFSNILTQEQFKKEYFVVADTEEKEALKTMKKGVLLTNTILTKIYEFIWAVKNKNESYFYNIAIEDRSKYDELLDNFRDNMIAQPLLNDYFNIVMGEKIFPENSYFIEVLKDRDKMFQITPDDNSKKNGKKRYKIDIEYDPSFININDFPV